jgi:hypothetical protein
MELATEPDLYAPSLDTLGNFIDKIPSFNNIKYGLLCPCGSRKDKTYDTYSTFSAHTKTKIHQKWLMDLNLNKTNHYTENITLKTTIRNQRLIIAKLEKDVQNKIMTIDYLTQQLVIHANSKSVNDLLGLDD